MSAWLVGVLLGCASRAGAPAVTTTAPASEVPEWRLGGGEPFVDPHLDHQIRLKAELGQPAALERYRQARAAHPDDIVLAYAAALLEPADTRRALLEAHVNAHPDFGPALYDLSLEYSARYRGVQTLADRRAERGLLERYLQAVDARDVYRWFRDPKVAEERIQDARARLARLTSPASPPLDEPVRFSVLHNDSGWMVVLTIAEAGVQEVLVSSDGGPFVSLGQMDTVANTMHRMPRDAPAQLLRFRYVDARGDAQGPFELAFDPAVALPRSMRQMLEYTPPAQWVMLRDDPANPRRLLYYPLLASFRCAVREARIGFDGPPDQALPLPPCDPTDPYGMPPGVLPFIPVPPATDAVTLQVTWFDESTSDVITSPYVGR